MKFRKTTCSSIVALLLLAASWFDVVVVVAYKDNNNQSNNVAFKSSSRSIKIMVVPTSASSAQRKAKPWFTPRGRMFTLSSGPSRAGSGH